VAELRSAVAPERSGAVFVAIEPASTPPPDVTLGSRPFTVVGVAHGEDPVDAGWEQFCDVVVRHDEPALDRVAANLDRSPIAGTTLALLLRGVGTRSVDEGLVEESSAYSVLQSGPEFAAWRSSVPAREGGDGDGAARVRAEREGGTLRVTLTRPSRLNALDARMRDELVEALTVAVADSAIRSVELHGEGRAFCSGGDLDEFGQRADPASAHVVRLQRSIGRMLANLEAETTAFVHGATMGSGVELAAFCDRVVADDDTQIALPEIGLGLIPGAGGTVSLPARIGRTHTAWLAFSGCTIDAGTALAWGLVDEVGGSPP
jgi:hypothetical protein